jgi:prophage maintenance system killer protein
VRKRSRTVAEIAREADVDLDEALVSLWDAGLTDIEDVTSVITVRDLRRARHALGLEDSRDQLTIAYWEAKSHLTRDELAMHMSALGVNVDATSRRIPRSSLRKFRLAFGDSEPLISAPPTTPPAPAFESEWLTIGKTPIRRYLTEDEIESMHAALTEDFSASANPIFPPGVRDRNLLSSAAFRPQTSNGDYLKYPTAEMAGAALFHSVCLDHAFHNGNKRTGIVALLAYLFRPGPGSWR